MSKRHLGIDVRAEAVYWVRARARRRGLEPEATGRIARDPAMGDTALAKLLRGAGRGCRIEVALRDPALALRCEMPPRMRGRELTQMATRRAERLARDTGEDAYGAWTGGSPLWLAAVSGQSARNEVVEWEQRGVAVHRMQSRHLALGRIAALLASDGLVALLDLEEFAGICVIANCHGWVFSREFSVRIMGDRGTHPGMEPAFDTTSARAIDLDDATLEDEKEDESSAPDPLERLAQRAERIAIELRRTFRYVAGEIRLGEVRRVLLAGEDPELRELEQALAGALELPVALLGNALPEGPGRELASAGVVALGLALAPDVDGGNLVPPEIRQRRDALAMRRRLRTALGCMVVIAAAASLFLHHRANLLDAAAVQLQALWDRETARRSFVGEVQRAREKSTRIREAFAQLDRPKPSWVALLDTLGRLAPEEAFVERLQVRRIDDAWHVELAIEAVGAEDGPLAGSISEYIGALRKSPLLAIDEIEQEESVVPDPNTSASVRFRVSGRLATVATRPLHEPASIELEP